MNHKNRLTNNRKHDIHCTVHNQHIHVNIYWIDRWNNQWNKYPKCRLQLNWNISTSSGKYWIHILMMVRWNNGNHKTRFSDRKQNNHSILHDQYIYPHVYRKYMRNNIWNFNPISRLQQHRNTSTSGSKYWIHIQWME